MNWNKEIEKTMNHTYMILTKTTFFGEEKESDYRLPMLLQNKISGLLSVSMQAINGENHLYYDISSMEALEDIAAKKELDYKTVRELLAGCVNVYSSIEEYLLDGQQLILLPEYIYLEPNNSKPMFTFYPEYSKDPHEAFKDLVEYILENLDHTDERTVMLGYKAYKITKTTNFTMRDIENILLEENNVKEEVTERQVEEINLNYEIKKPEETEATILLTEDMKEKTNFQINDIKDKLTSISGEFLGILVSAVVVIVLSGFLMVNINFGYMDMTNKTILYILGGIAMSFVSLLLFAYTFSKKRKMGIA